MTTVLKSWQHWLGGMSMPHESLNTGCQFRQTNLHTLSNTHTYKKVGQAIVSNQMFHRRTHYAKHKAGASAAAATTG